MIRNPVSSNVVAVCMVRVYFISCGIALVAACDLPCCGHSRATCALVGGGQPSFCVSLSTMKACAVLWRRRRVWR